MILGIDLGTTFSAGAYLDDHDIVHIINSSEGGKLTSSVVLFDSDENIIVGNVAKDNAMMRPADVISVVKNFIGKKKILKIWGGKEYTPEMISSFIIRKIIQDAEHYTGAKISAAVITVPAYFTDAQRKATEDAAILAGIRLAGMINEPTAAALCYLKNHNVRNENLLVYDLGGGTFDVTILHVNSNNEITVKSTGGLSNAGGRFFDQLIVDYVCECISEKYGIDLEDEEYLDELNELYQKAENAKIQLSQKSLVNISLKIGKIKEQTTLTRDQFERMIQKIYLRTEAKIKETLAAAKLTPADIHKVLLVGGSSRIPFISNHIQQYLNMEPSKEVDPDEAVAVGAAIYAQILSKQDAATRFTDVCSHSIGVAVVNERTKMEENEIIISRNSSLPIEQESRFRTMIQNQRKIELTITEGEFKEVTDVTIIGKFEIQLPSGLPEKALVLIKIGLDIYQLIHIKVSIPEANFEEEYHMKRVANMDQDTIQNTTGILRDFKIS